MISVANIVANCPLILGGHSISCLEADNRREQRFGIIALPRSPVALTQTPCISDWRLTKVVGNAIRTGGRKDNVGIQGSVTIS